MSRTGNQNRYARIRAEREAAVALEVAQLCADGARPIAGYPAYLILPSGVVYSTYGRRVIRVRPGIKPGGYEFVGLRNMAGTKYKMVHRLVADTFIANPDDLPEVNHKDGNKRNNSAANLEWCTRKANAQHGADNGLIPIGTRSRNAKLDADSVRQVRAAAGSYHEIGRRFGVCAQTVCKIKRRAAYRDVPEAA